MFRSAINMHPVLARAYEFSRAGGKHMVEQHLKRGKLLVRERISKLIDSNTSFHELSPLAGYQMYEGEGVPCGGIVTGFGVVAGRYCLVVANDATVKGGTLFPVTVKKQLRAMEIAMQRHIPCLYLVDSGGAFLPLQTDIFPDKNHGGRTFFLQARMSSIGIPQCAAIMGSCTAGAAYVPAMSDETIIVDKTGTVFLGGPPLVKAAVGETVTAEELGGARVHSVISGLTDYFCNDDLHAIETLRSIVSHFGDFECDRKFQRPSPCLELELLEPREDMHRIVSLIVKGFHEFKQRYDGECLITGYGRCGGIAVGLIAVKGSKLTARAMSKAAHFVQLCEKRSFPIVFLSAGDFSASPSNESPEGIKAGARLGQAMAALTVPTVTFNIGPIVGWTSTFFGSRAFDPTFLYSWPNASVKLTENKNMDADDEVIYRAVPALQQSARVEDDGIILPQDTPVVLFDSLQIAMSGTKVTKKDDRLGVHLDVHYNTSLKGTGNLVFRM